MAITDSYTPPHPTPLHLPPPKKRKKNKQMYYTQTKKTMNTENISGMFIVFWPITCETLQPQKNERVSQSQNGDLVLILFPKTFILTYKNLNCYFFLSESHMHYGNKKMCEWSLACCGCIM